LLTTINKLIEVMADTEKAFKENRLKEVSRLKTKFRQEINKLSIERNRIASLKAELYGDYKEEIISLEDYKDMRQRFERKQENLDLKISKLNDDIYHLENNNMYSTEAAQTFIKYSGIKEITRELIGDLIESIIVDSDKNIKIIFKFQDEISKYTEI
jgi:hypothetical protein